jgi:hypothetical protein
LGIWRPPDAAITRYCPLMQRNHPNTVAAFAEWDAKLADVVKRMRCTACDKKLCTAKTMRETAPRKYTSH